MIPIIDAWNPELKEELDRKLLETCSELAVAYQRGDIDETGFKAAALYIDKALRGLVDEEVLVALNAEAKEMADRTECHTFRTESEIIFLSKKSGSESFRMNRIRDGKESVVKEYEFDGINSAEKATTAYRAMVQKIKTMKGIREL